MYCTYCGQEFSPGTRFCTSCGKPITPQGKLITQQGKSVDQIEHDLHLVLPIGTPGSALLAGYLGLFSVLIIPAPLALITGIIGLIQIKKSGKPYGRVRCWTGILLGGLFSLVLIYLLIMILIA